MINIILKYFVNFYFNERMLEIFNIFFGIIGCIFFFNFVYVFYCDNIIMYVLGL